MPTESNLTPSPSRFTQDQIPEAVKELFSYPKFVSGMEAFLPNDLFQYILKNKAEIKTSHDFQEKLIVPFLQYIINESTDGLTSSGLERLERDRKYLFISNHRDIGLDSAFLNFVLFKQGFSTCQIAIGDNLLKHRVAELAFKINKSFSVNRSGSAREKYYSSVALSKYIANTITQKSDSIWLAQREGRAKDGNDLTQTGVLKMLGLSSSSDLRAHFQDLNIVPVAITYELDPCDALKTKEHINKRHSPEYQKTFEEDLTSILQGFRGNKGKVHVAFGTPINDQLETLPVGISDKELLQNIAKIIDKEIHLKYQLNPINYRAYDLFSETPSIDRNYDEKLKNYFRAIINSFPKPIQEEAKTYLLSMYANPVTNRNKASS